MGELICLANCSNLMLWDDHELRNDWGAFPKDRDTGSMNYKLGLAARRCLTGGVGVGVSVDAVICVSVDAVVCWCCYFWLLLLLPSLMLL